MRLFLSDLGKFYLAGVRDYFSLTTKLYFFRYDLICLILHGYYIFILASPNSDTDLSAYWPEGEILRQKFLLFDSVLYFQKAYKAT